MTATEPPLLRVDGLSKHFPLRGGLLRRVVGQVRAVDDVSLEIRSGETLGLVGESGCGKTTLGRCIVRSAQPSAGRLEYRTPTGEVVDLAGMDRAELRRHQREIRLVFQDPFSSLNPRMTLLQLVGEPLRRHREATGSELEERVAAMLRRVGLRPEYMRRYPHAFSGGERQRVNIARALILEPRLVVADEAVSALDVSVRAQILNLLRDLQEELGLTYLFISHDLSVVEYLCDRVAVMYLGKIVEEGATREVFRAPKHPYTEALLASVPRPDPRTRGERRKHLATDIPDPANPPDGCRFHTRCPYRRDPVCTGEVPALDAAGAGRRAACHLDDELVLTGIEGVGPPAAARSDGSGGPVEPRTQERGTQR